MAHSLVVGLWYFNTPPETNIAPENGWLEYYFRFGAWPIFKCELLVLGRVHVAFFQRCQVLHCLELAGVGVVSCRFTFLPGIQHRIKLLFCGPTGTGCALKRMFPILKDFTWDDGTPWKFNSSPPKNCRASKGKYRMHIVFQPLFFRGYVKLRGCCCLVDALMD